VHRLSRLVCRSCCESSTDLCNEYGWNPKSWYDSAMTFVVLTIQSSCPSASPAAILATLLWGVVALLVRATFAGGSPDERLNGRVGLPASSSWTDNRTTAPPNRCSVANRFRRYDTTERRSKLVVSYTRRRQGGKRIGSERIVETGKDGGGLVSSERSIAFRSTSQVCDDVVRASLVVKLLTNFRHIDVGRYTTASDIVTLCWLALQFVDNM